MRVLLVGSPSRRALLRAQLNGPMEIAGEFPTLAAAESADLDVDAIILGERGANRSSTQHDDPGRPWSARNDDIVQEPLTPREIQVLELLAEGLPNKAIAERLRISDQTVKFHVSSISGKLGAANRTDAVRRAVRRGLITL
jgi:DNA-binding NarL/FixJ family response regulator